MSRLPSPRSSASIGAITVVLPCPIIIWFTDDRPSIAACANSVTSSYCRLRNMKPSKNSKTRKRGTSDNFAFGESWVAKRSRRVWSHLGCMKCRRAVSSAASVRDVCSIACSMAPIILTPTRLSTAPSSHSGGATSVCRVDCRCPSRASLAAGACSNPVAAPARGPDSHDRAARRPLGTTAHREAAPSLLPCCTCSCASLAVRDR
eukprot:4876425-Prymnesium_polylepis.2